MAKRSSSRRTRLQKKQAKERRRRSNKNKLAHSNPAVAKRASSNVKGSATSQSDPLLQQSEKWFWHDARHSLLATLFILILLSIAWYLLR